MECEIYGLISLRSAYWGTEILSVLIVVMINSLFLKRIMDINGKNITCLKQMPVKNGTKNGSAAVKSKVPAAKNGKKAEKKASSSSSDEDDSDSDVKPKVPAGKNGKKVQKEESSSDEDDSDSDEEVRFHLIPWSIKFVLFCCFLCISRVFYHILLTEPILLYFIAYQGCC